MENKYYIYFHINPLKNIVFYVGKGFGNRAYRKYGRNKHWHNTVKKYGIIIDIIEENLSEEYAIEREKFYISKIGRRDQGKGTLINLTDGGEGVSGLKHSDESNEKNRQWHLGKSPWNKGLKGYGLGKKLSEETKSKMRKPKPIGHKIKGFSGKHSEETKLKISETKKRKHQEKLNLLNGD